MSEIKVSKLGKVCFTHFESKVIPVLEAYPSKVLFEVHNFGEAMMIAKTVPLPNVAERLWQRRE